MQMCPLCYSQCWPNGQCSACGFWDLPEPKAESKAEPEPKTEPEPEPTRAPARQINMLQVSLNTWMAEAQPNLWDWVQTENWSCLFEKFMELHPYAMIITK